MKALCLLIALGSVTFLSADLSSNTTSYKTVQPRNNMIDVTVKKDEAVTAVSDQELNKIIANDLKSNWFAKDYQNVTFDVHYGAVTLKGTVDSVDNKTKIEDRIKKIPGVLSVDDQITVAEPK